VDENLKMFWEKVKLGKFSRESENFLGNRGKIFNRGKCIIASGCMDAPSPFQVIGPTTEKECLCIAAERANENTKSLWAEHRSNIWMGHSTADHIFLRMALYKFH